MRLKNLDFENVIKNTPLIAIDFCIYRDKKILLGKRINSPAKNNFFVPGGRILKGESIKIASDRILKQELGYKLISDTRKTFLGVYEHFYDDNFLGNQDFKTHYIILAYLINIDYLIKIDRVIDKDQHSEYLWQSINSKYESQYIHNYTKEYLKDIRKRID